MKEKGTNEKKRGKSEANRVDCIQKGQILRQKKMLEKYTRILVNRMVFKTILGTL